MQIISVSNVAAIANSSPVLTSQAMRNLPNYEAIKDNVLAAMSYNTRKTYKKVLTNFVNYCNSEGLAPFDVSSVASYLASLSTRNIAVASIKNANTAINKLFSANGLAKPSSYQVIKDLISGISKRDERPQKQAKAIPLNSVVSFCYKAESKTLKQKRDKAIILLGYFGAFRRSELTRLRFEHVEHCEKGLTITLKTKGAKWTVKQIPYAKAPELCPILALYTYIRAANLTDGAIFRSVGKDGKIKGKPLYDGTINRIIKASLGKEYSAHSLRVGIAVAHCENGVNSCYTEALAGWTDARMYKRYTKQAETWQNAQSII